MSSDERHTSLSTASAPLAELAYSVVVPVYNEAENIVLFCRKAVAELPPGFELLVCYDFDADATLPALAAMPPGEKPAAVRLVPNDLGPGVAMRSRRACVRRGPPWSLS